MVEVLNEAVIGSCQTMIGLMVLLDIRVSLHIVEFAMTLVLN